VGGTRPIPPLELLNNMLFEIQEEEAIDAIEEERIWSQIG
jgi:hypothetical protein